MSDGRGRLGRLLRARSSAPRPRPDPLDEPVHLPAHVVYHHWGFDEPVDRMDWLVEVRTDPGVRVGEYLALFSGSIDGSPCYLGLQTDVRDPSAGRGVGKGLIFSTWWSFDRSDLRIAPGGFCELGTHEGTFIGVRNRFDWGAGRYRVVLARTESDRVHDRELDWFELTIADVDAPADARPFRSARCGSLDDDRGSRHGSTRAGCCSWRCTPARRRGGTCRAGMSMSSRSATDGRVHRAAPSTRRSPTASACPTPTSASRRQRASCNCRSGPESRGSIAHGRGADPTDSARHRRRSWVTFLHARR